MWSAPEYIAAIVFLCVLGVLIVTGMCEDEDDPNDPSNWRK